MGLSEFCSFGTFRVFTCDFRFLKHVGLDGYGVWVVDVRAFRE